MGSYFHVAPVPLAPGSVIEPGNWGRIIKYHLSNSFPAHREAVYELVRMKEFPELPSRLDALFFMDVLQDAVAYRHNDSPLGLLYEVELLTPSAAMHRAKISDVYRLQQTHTPTVADLETVARKYWCGASSAERGTELVAVSAVRILRRCE